MKAFTKYTGIVAVIDRANIDTDAIIAKQFLKSIQRTGFGEQLFYDWRYLADGSDNPEFILNQAPFREATILVGGNNFGCGSSREHAVWAVAQYGFRAVIAPRREQNGEVTPAFADIFKNNCVKNGLLTVELSEAEVAEIQQAVNDEPGLEITVDLETQTVVVPGDPVRSFSFEIDPGTREFLLRGLDQIDVTLQDEAGISEFEKQHDLFLG